MQSEAVLVHSCRCSSPAPEDMLAHAGPCVGAAVLITLTVVVEPTDVDVTDV